MVVSAYGLEEFFKFVEVVVNKLVKELGNFENL